MSLVIAIGGWVNLSGAGGEWRKEISSGWHLCDYVEVPGDTPL